MSTRSYIVAVLTFLFLLGACSTQPPIMVDHASELTLDAIEQQVSIVTLDLDLATDPLAVDPAVVLDLVSGEVVDQLFSGLTDFATDSMVAKALTG